MGIVGLHKSLAFCTKKGSLRDFSGQILAVDASSWLHKSVYSISERYVESTENDRLEPTCVQVSSKYVIRRCQELLNVWHISKVVLVMDGKRCPLKADTNQDRENRRQQNLFEARRLKRQGNHDKAEEKYKACIKIRDDLTKAVMEEVKKHFVRDRGVELIWSPYEADAQLVKLCMDCRADAVITEDSDVLVYSAASHCSFPVLFKLDRHSGSCDIVDMEWLLSAKRLDSSSHKKGKTSLETLLKHLASRQFRQPGFGVRLFVQACVLAGCDYAPSRLNGVGLVNSFKNIRDNAYRDHACRFEKVLASFPQKVRNQIDVKEYELLLAKSEAVFYYHPVFDIEGKITPLNDTRMGDEEPGEVEHSRDHFPFLQRFDKDYSFLGEMEKPKPPVHEKPPVQEISIPPKNDFSSFSPKSFEVEYRVIDSLGRKRPRGGGEIMQNPYRSNKSGHLENRQPLARLNSNDARNLRMGNNPFSKFARKCDAEPSSKRRPGNLKYLQQQEDVRFVKRNFHENGGKPVSRTLQQAFQRNSLLSATVHAPQDIHAAKPGSFASVEARPKLESNQDFEGSASGKEFEQVAGSFDYSVDRDGRVDLESIRASNTTTSLDEVRGRMLLDCGILSGAGLIHTRRVATDNGCAETSSAASELNATIDLTSNDSFHATLDSSDPDGIQHIIEHKYDVGQHDDIRYTEELNPSIHCDTTVRSKYFSQQGNTRRVTLDAWDQAPPKGIIVSGCNDRAALEGEALHEAFIDSDRGTSPIAQRREWGNDEEIESPQPEIAGNTFYGNYCSNPFKWRPPKKSVSRSLPISLGRNSRPGTQGTLEHAFRRQQQLAGVAPSRPQSHSNRFGSEGSFSTKQGRIYDPFQPQSPPVRHIEF